MTINTLPPPRLRWSPADRSDPARVARSGGLRRMKVGTLRSVCAGSTVKWTVLRSA